MTEPPNPYAPSEALAHDAAGELAADRQAGPSRLLATATSLFAFPLLGAGFYLLGKRRRFLAWVILGLVGLVSMIVTVRIGAPRPFMAALALSYLGMLAATIDTALARPRTSDGRSLGLTGGRAWTAAIVLVVAAKCGGVAVKRGLIEAFQMPSGSMAPTLLVGDHIFVSKGRGGVGRGDVIVFEFPNDPNIDYLKRVIAVGGDTVETRDGVVSVNGTPLAQQSIEAPCVDRESGPTGETDEPCTFVRETSDGGSYTVMFTERSRSDFPPTVVPPGRVFVLGDNRDNSSDSRVWGTVAVGAIKGTAKIVYWSSDETTGARPARIGIAVE